MQKILIVDDDTFMLKLSAMILSKHYKTVSASSGNSKSNSYACPGIALGILGMKDTTESYLAGIVPSSIILASMEFA